LRPQRPDEAAAGLRPPSIYAKPSCPAADPCDLPRLLHGPHRVGCRLVMILLSQARKAAGDRDVAIAGGAATINQYLAAGLVDELRTHIAAVTLGADERLFDGVPPLHLEVLAVRAASLTTHISYRILH
jgi:riboflavin biosynthesis pyrimidine reductase